MTESQGNHIISALLLCIVLLAAIFASTAISSAHADNRAHDQLVVSCAALPAGSYTPHQCEGLNP